MPPSAAFSTGICFSGKEERRRLYISQGIYGKQKNASGEKPAKTGRNSPRTSKKPKGKVRESRPWTPPEAAAFLHFFRKYFLVILW